MGYNWSMATFIVGAVGLFLILAGTSALMVKGFRRNTAGTSASGSPRNDIPQLNRGGNVVNLPPQRPLNGVKQGGIKKPTQNFVYPKDSLPDDFLRL